MEKKNLYLFIAGIILIFIHSYFAFFTIKEILTVDWGGNAGRYFLSNSITSIYVMVVGVLTGILMILRKTWTKPVGIILLGSLLFGSIVNIILRFWSFFIIINLISSAIGIFLIILNIKSK